jgi:hypothetical protein
MKISKIKIGIVSFTVLVFMVLSLPLFVYAKPAQALETGSGGSDSGSSQVGGSDTSSNGQVAQTGKLEGIKLRACQNRERVITAVMARVQDRAQKQLQVFDKVAEHVQAFYESKGYQSEQYDELVANMNAKRIAAQNATQTMAQNGGFSCGGDAPRGTLDGFSTQAKAANATLKDYKTAVQDLIVDVKSAASEVTE